MYAIRSYYGQDLANISFQGRLRNIDLNAPACYDGAVAASLSAEALAIYSVPLHKTKLIANRQAASMRPGDLFIMSWPPYHLESMIQRIQRIVIGQLEDGAVEIEARNNFV